METARGMVQVAGTTYRIVRLAAGAYAAVRIQDDAQVGTFTTRPLLRVTSSRIESAITYQIARLALMSAKTSWARRLAPG